MKKLRAAKPSAEELKGLGVPASYAWQLANGKRSPSLSLAFKIEDELRISVQVWRLA